MEYYCKRCGHYWNSRKDKKPLACPKCKSPYWNQPKKRVSKELIESSTKMIIIVHDMIIKESGGTFGIRDSGGIYNAAYRILNYVNKNIDNPYSIGAFVYQDLAKRHHFVDGNKRTAHCFAKIILLSIGYHLKPKYCNATEFILAIARDKNPKTFKEIRDWINKNSTKIIEKEITTYLKELYYDITYEKRGSQNE